MPLPRWLLAGASLSLFGCDASGGPVPSDMYLTLSVSTQDLAVATAVNGKRNDFASSESGAMAASIPLNQFVHEGDNDVSFVLSLMDSDGAPEPGFLAALEISLSGDIVDTMTPSERAIFSRTLDDGEVDALLAGETLTIEQSFRIEQAALEKIRKSASQ